MVLMSLRLNAGWSSLVGEDACCLPVLPGGLGCCSSSSLGEDGTRFSLPGGVSRTLLSCLDSMRSDGEKGWT